MTTVPLSAQDRDPDKIVRAVRELQDIVNTKGTVELRATETTTVVTDARIAPGSAVFLAGTDATTRGEILADTLYVEPADIEAGQFTIHHPSGSARSVWWTIARP